MKFFTVSIFLSLFFGLSQLVYAEDPIIIPRASWGANSLYNAINSDYWQNILAAREAAYAKNEDKEPTPAQLAAREKTKQINDYLNENFSYQFDIDERVSTSPSTGQDLAWKFSYADVVDGIVIHHTDSEYENTLEGMKDIHRFHSLNRQWGDIGYNYIIGYDGKIYEGREGGDYVVGAHSKYNNIGTVGIAIMGNYQETGINAAQYESLDSLIKFLTKKYGIDLNKKRYYHTDCAFSACNVFPIETYLDESLVGHRDTGHTSCPGDKLYEQIQIIRTSNLEYTKGFTPVVRGESQNNNTATTFQTSQIQKIFGVLEKYTDTQVAMLINIIDERLMTETQENMRKTLQLIKTASMLRLK